MKNPQKYIYHKAKKWAERNQIYCIKGGEKQDDALYVSKPEDNVFRRSISSADKAEFTKGSGSELEKNGNSMPKFWALYSSSAGAVNFFQYWKGNDDNGKVLKPLNSSLGARNKKLNISFEKQYQIISSSRGLANVDVVLEANDFVVAIESKMYEPYRDNPKPLNETYFKKEHNGLWKGMTSLNAHMSAFNKGEEKYSYLDVKQLTTHLLGLRRVNSKDKFQLIYFWYDVPLEDGFKLRKEIERFSSVLAKDNINFSAISYQEFILNLTKVNNISEDYINYLSDRYL